MERHFVEEDVLYRRTFCMGGRFVEGRLVGRMFCSGGRFVEGRFVLVPHLMVDVNPRGWCWPVLILW